MGDVIRIEDLNVPYFFLNAEFLNEYIDFLRALLKFIKKRGMEVITVRFYPLEKHKIKHLSVIATDKSGNTMHCKIFINKQEYYNFEFREAMQIYDEHAYFEYITYQKLPDVLDEIFKILEIEKKNEASKTVNNIEIDKNFYCIVREK